MNFFYFSLIIATGGSRLDFWKAWTNGFLGKCLIFFSLYLVLLYLRRCEILRTSLLEGSRASIGVGSLFFNQENAYS